MCDEKLPGMKYPKCDAEILGRRPVLTERRTRLVAPSAPIRKSDCSAVSRVDSASHR